GPARQLLRRQPVSLAIKRRLELSRQLLGLEAGEGDVKARHSVADSEQLPTEANTQAGQLAGQAPRSRTRRFAVAQRAALKLPQVRPAAGRWSLDQQHAVAAPDDNGGFPHLHHRWRGGPDGNGFLLAQSAGRTAGRQRTFTTARTTTGAYQRA